MTVVSMRPAAMLAESQATVDTTTEDTPDKAEGREFIHDTNAWDEW